MAGSRNFNKSLIAVAIVARVSAGHAQTSASLAVGSDQTKTTSTAAPASTIAPTGTAAPTNTTAQKGAAPPKPAEPSPPTAQAPAALSATPAPAADSPEATAPTADMELYQLYAEASKLHDAGQFDAAYERYLGIWAEKRGYDVAASMGDIELRRKQFALAASHFRFALDHMPVTQNKLYLTTLQDGFAKARQQVAEVSVTAHPTVTGLQVSNGLTGEQYNQPFYLPPGHHTLKIMATGYQVVLQEVTAAEAATIDLDVYLNATGTPVTPDPKRTVKKRHPEWVFPIGGLVTVGLGAGATWSLLDAQNKHDDLVALGIGATECNASSSRRCANADDLADKTESRQTLGWALAGGAVAAAGATVLVWWLWETDVPLDVAYDGRDNELTVRWNHAF